MSPQPLSARCSQLSSVTGRSHLQTCGFCLGNLPTSPCPILHCGEGSLHHVSSLPVPVHSLCPLALGEMRSWPLPDSVGISGLAGVPLLSSSHPLCPQARLPLGAGGKPLQDELCNPSPTPESLRDFQGVTESPRWRGQAKCHPCQGTVCLRPTATGQGIGSQPLCPPVSAPVTTGRVVEGATLAFPHQPVLPGKVLPRSLYLMRRGNGSVQSALRLRMGSALCTVLKAVISANGSFAGGIQIATTPFSLQIFSPPPALPTPGRKTKAPHCRVPAKPLWLRMLSSQGPATLPGPSPG